MYDVPTTRYSLLVRLQTSEEEEAWIDFCGLYEPAIYRYARRKGLSQADAQDVVQEVLSAVTGSIHTWQPRAGKGSFRRWLARVARNAAVNMFKSNARREAGIGGTQSLDLLQRLAADDPRDDVLECEVRRQTFRRAAERVRPVVSRATWQAFSQTAIVGKPAAEVAEQLGMSVGAVYTAKCRVLASIRREVETLMQAEEL